MSSCEERSHEERSHEERSYNQQDEQLKILLAENLPVNFELLILAYQHKLTAIVYLICGPQHAEDIVQDTFINAYKGLLKLSPSEIRALKLRPWLAIIARNLSLNHKRKHKNFTSISTDLPEGREFLEATEIGQYASPEGKAEWKESCEELYIYIRQLPDHLRLAVTLHYIAGLEYHEIAEKLGQPLDTVKSNGLRGLRKLRKMMEERESNT